MLEAEQRRPEVVITLNLLQELLGRPWTGKEIESHLKDNTFHLAVLSANKARLVVRDWIHTPLDSLSKFLDRYIRALRIINPSGSSVRVFGIPAIINALKTSSPNIVRG